LPGKGREGTRGEERRIKTDGRKVRDERAKIRERRHVVVMVVEVERVIL